MKCKGARDLEDVTAKICNKCGVEKEINEFELSSSGRDGHRCICKKCRYEYGGRESCKKYRRNHKEKIRECKKKYAQEHEDQRKGYFILYNQEHKEEHKKYYQEHREERNERQRKYRKKRKEIDVNFKLAQNLRTRIYRALKRNSKLGSTMILLGCSIECLKTHLESRFQYGMTWENYGYYGWHIDHIEPCDKFDLTKKEEQKRCFHYTNLQPLWAIDNLNKAASI